MCEPDCLRCPTSFDLNQFIDVCSEASDDVEGRPMKRSKIEEKPKLFLHVSQSIPKWAEQGWEIIRFTSVRGPEFKSATNGDVRLDKNGDKTVRKGKRWRERCEVYGCEKGPTFGPPEERARHCLAHRTDGEINVVSKRCIVDGCDYICNFGPPGHRPRHCSTHRMDGEINVFGARCVVDGCRTHPSYGLPEERPRHCLAHRTDGEINVVSKRCVVDGCEKHPTFGQPGQRPLHCFSHRAVGDIDVINRKCCADGCTTHPRFGPPGHRAQHCSRHRIEGEVNVVDQRCPHPDHNWQPKHERPLAFYRLDDKCLCHQHFYLRVNKKCRAIRREILVLGNLIATLPPMLGLTHDEFNQYFVGHDFTTRSCKLIRRPDMLFCEPKFAVLLEIDEHGHRSYSELNELEHLDVIRRWVLDTFGQKHMFVLRVNPDGREPMFRKSLTTNGEQVWKPTEHCEAKMAQVCEQLVPWVRAGIDGPVPMELMNAHQGVFVQKIFY